MTKESKKAKELNLKVVHVHMGIFDFEVIGVIGDYSKMSEYIQWKFEEKDFDADSWDMEYVPRGKCFFKQGYVPVIWIPRKPKTAREHATLAHESLHAVFHLFEWANLPLTRDTEEVMAHAMAHIATTLIDSLNK